MENQIIKHIEELNQLFILLKVISKRAQPELVELLKERLLEKQEELLTELE